MQLIDNLMSVAASVCMPHRGSAFIAPVKWQQFGALVELERHSTVK